VTEPATGVVHDATATSASADLIPWAVAHVREGRCARCVKRLDHWKCDACGAGPFQFPRAGGTIDFPERFPFGAIPVFEPGYFRGGNFYYDSEACRIELEKRGVRQIALSPAVPAPSAPAPEPIDLAELGLPRQVYELLGKRRAARGSSTELFLTDTFNDLAAVGQLDNYAAARRSGLRGVPFKGPDGLDATILARARIRQFIESANMLQPDARNGLTQLCSEFGGELTALDVLCWLAERL
jgi:hypothetical protein